MTTTVRVWPPEDPSADEIREARLRANLSQLELSRVLGTMLGPAAEGFGPTVGTVAHWEQGVQKPRGANRGLLLRWMRRYPPPEDAA